jgi:hypothetical protein
MMRAGVEVVTVHSVGKNCHDDYCSKDAPDLTDAIVAVIPVKSIVVGRDLTRLSGP